MNEIFDGSHDGGAICEGAQIQDQDSDGYPARHYQVDETFGGAELYRPKRGSGGINRF
ncbi:MAG: hypothetical protein H6867_00750 [Rhodospirillales bacterium]|nr:hypothetical protein [Rhodospirillales bacterium]